MNIQMLIKKLDCELENEISKSKVNLNELTEIRLRTNQYLQLLFGNNEKIIKYKINKKILQNIILSLTDYSVYSIEQDLKKGFFTIAGGHRVGVCGKIILENNNIKNITNISSLIIRVAKEIIGLSDKIIKYCVPRKNILVISPPCCGKTTLIRDLTRNFSNNGYKVTVVDERSEICGMYFGVAEKDIGFRTDVLDSCPKDIGLNMAIRTCNPDIVVLDEIGTDKDLLGLYNAFNSGVNILATVHSDNIETFKIKKEFKRLINEKLIDLYIVLDRKDKNIYTKRLFNKDFEVIACL